MKAVFLDRDGVINENRDDHVKAWAEVRFVPGSLDALARLHRAGIAVFIITNQAIINRGMITSYTVDAINSRIARAIERAGGSVVELAYCPHRPDELCDCRKPRPGLLLRLARDHRIDLDRSVVVGDALTDTEAGRAAGCHSILVLSGRGRRELARARGEGLNSFSIASDLNAAVSLVIRRLSPVGEAVPALAATGWQGADSGVPSGLELPSERVAPTGAVALAQTV